jgi:type II secretory pathway component PulC
VVLRVLAIRQVFLLSDWVVILLIVAGACYAAVHFLGMPMGQPEVQSESDAAGDASGADVLMGVKPRAAYDRIVTSGLFGSAGKTVQEKPAAAPSPDVEETKLRLKLCGTSATKPHDLFASAIILNEEKNQVGTFCVGQEVVDKVTLEEVWQRKVILLNKAANRREVLRSDSDTKEGSSGGAPATPQPKLTPGAGANRVTLKKQEIVQDLVANYADLVTQIKPELYHDAEGNVAGITASNLESMPIAQKLGVKNGDVLQTVNNEAIDSEEKIMELVNKYRNSSTFRIGLLRDGKPVVVTYKLE